MNSNRCKLLGSLAAIPLLLAGCAGAPSKPPEVSARVNTPSAHAHGRAGHVPLAVALGPQASLLPGWSDRSRVEHDGLVDFVDSRAPLPALPPMDGASVIGKILLRHAPVTAPVTVPVTAPIASGAKVTGAPQVTAQAELPVSITQSPRVDVDKLLMLSTSRPATAATDQRKKLIESDWACGDPELSGSIYHFGRDGSLVINASDRQHQGSYALLEQYKVLLVKDATDKGTVFEQVAGADDHTLYLKNIQGGAVMRCTAQKNGRYQNDEGFIFGEYQELSAIWRCGPFGVLKFDELGHYAWNGASGNFVLKKNNARLDILLLEGVTPAGPFRRMIELDVDQSRMARGAIQVRLSGTGAWNACTAQS